MILRQVSAQPEKNMGPYNSICEAEQLLFLFLSLLKMSLDQSLEFRQVLLHALAVNVLRGVVCFKNTEHGWQHEPMTCQ